MEEINTEVLKASNQNVVDSSTKPKVDEESPQEEIKHPLQNTWSFWMFTNEKRNWEDNLIELTTFDTVEDYWWYKKTKLKKNLYHHMKLPSELPFGQDYMVFKKGIRPMWEDRANKKGGRWIISLDRKSMNMDRVWMYVVLLLIGENFENSNSICGAVVNVRCKSKIGVWLSDKNNEKANREIGRKLREQLQISGKISFHEHDSNASMYTA